MIHTFEANNFRCFEGLRLGDLRTINIVVGRSASGKTALLEAIRVALAGTPVVAWGINNTRGTFFGIPANPTREQFEAPWSSLFPDSNSKKVINFKLTDSRDREASLGIYYDYEKAVTPTASGGPSAQSPSASVAPVSSPSGAQMPTSIIPLAFARAFFSGVVNILLATLNQQGQLYLEQGPELSPPSEYIPSQVQLNSIQTANWFSQLSIANREKDIVEIVRRQFPEIKDLSIQAPAGLPLIHATLAHNSKKVPVSLVSSGINKFLTIMIAIRTCKLGVVLVDEIENGIYYDMFPAFWELIHRIAIESNTQLFLTTHSWEFLKSATGLIDNHKGDFSFIQVFQDHGTSNALVVPGQDAAAAIENGIEVRR